MRTHGGKLAVSACLFGCLATALPAQQSIHPDIQAADIQRGFHDSAIVVRLVDGLSIHNNFEVVGDSVLNDVDAAEMLEESLLSIGAMGVRPVLPFEPADKALAEILGLTSMYLVTIDGSMDSTQASEWLESQNLNVLSASPIVVGEALYDDGPNDPGFASQYSLHNLGQRVDGVPGIFDSDVDAVEAWTLSSGAGQILIAVLDSGISNDHPDLMHKLQDGYNSTGAGDIDDTHDPYNSHGTHVAGIAAAQSNNGQGMTGMSWGSPILPIKMANLLGFTSDVWLSEGLIWAVDNGASVAVISFGLDNGSDLMHAAIQYAHDSGVVVCASSGNSGVQGVKYPAKYPETIAVGATDNQDQIAGFSTFGPEVTVVAPGVDIVSTWDDFNGPPTYSYESGTSAACPLVGGIVALMLSANPDLTPDQIIQFLRDSSEDLGDVGFDIKYGYGRVNAHRAVGLAKGIRVCIADVNFSGRVEFSDFSAWISAYIAGLSEADQNENGVVEPTDFTAFMANYNAGCS
jgi:subtilisin family serine protease